MRGKYLRGFADQSIDCLTVFVASTLMNDDLSNVVISAAVSALCSMVFPSSSTSADGSAPPATNAVLNSRDWACVWSVVRPACVVEGRVGVVGERVPDEVSQERV